MRRRRRVSRLDFPSHPPSLPPSLTPSLPLSFTHSVIITRCRLHRLTHSGSRFTPSLPLSRPSCYLEHAPISPRTLDDGRSSEVVGRTTPPRFLMTQFGNARSASPAAAASHQPRGIISDEVVLDAKVRREERGRGREGDADEEAGGEDGWTDKVRLYKQARVGTSTGCLKGRRFAMLDTSSSVDPLS